MTDAGFLTDWQALLERRPAFRDVLAPYESILRAWVVWEGASGARPAPLRWTAEECRERWSRGIPLAAEAPPLLEATAIEPLAEPTLEAERRPAAVLLVATWRFMSSAPPDGAAPAWAAPDTVCPRSGAIGRRPAPGGFPSASSERLPGSSLR